MKEYSFNTAYTQARELYGLELKSDEFETLGLIAWDKIGNKRYRLYKYRVNPTKDTKGEYYVDLPCNADQIEAITADSEDYQRTSPTSNTESNFNSSIEQSIEGKQCHTNSLYISGKYVKYRKEDNRIYLNYNFPYVNILYKGFIVDNEGLPLLNEKELDAIAGFCIWANTRKNAIMTKDNSTMQLAMYLEQNWKVLCSQARVPDYINQNEMDEILNVGSSWDRKKFGKSFKPIH